MVVFVGVGGETLGRSGALLWHLALPGVGRRAMHHMVWAVQQAGAVQVTVLM